MITIIYIYRSHIFVSDRSLPSGLQKHFTSLVLCISHWQKQNIWLVDPCAFPCTYALVCAMFVLILVSIINGFIHLPELFQIVKSSVTPTITFIIYARFLGSGLGLMRPVLDIIVLYNHIIAYLVACRSVHSCTLATLGIYITITLLCCTIQAHLSTFTLQQYSLTFHESICIHMCMYVCMSTCRCGSRVRIIKVDSLSYLSCNIWSCVYSAYPLIFS